jgi:predicted O-linked N-acetylglucosamine transferase (SPINDLY family)
MRSNASVPPSESELAELAKLCAAGDLVAAEQACRRLLCACSDHAPTWHALGVLQLALGQPETAVSSLKRAAQLAPGDAAICMRLGMAWQQAGRLDRAREQFAEAVRLAPHDHEARLLLAACAQELGLLDEARLQYKAALLLRPDDARAHNNLGSILEAQGEAAAAIDRYREAISRDAACFEAQLNLARALVRIAPASAGPELERAVALRPDSCEARAALADWHALYGRLPEARTHYDAVLRSRPRSLAWRLCRDMLAPPVFESNQHIDAWRAQIAERLHSYRSQELTLSLEDLASTGAKPPTILAYQGRNDLPLKRLFAEVFAAALAPCVQKYRWRPRRGSGLPSVAFVATGGGDRVFLRGMAGMLHRVTPGRFSAVLLCSAATAAAARAQITNPHVEIATLPGDPRRAVELLARRAFDVIYHWEVGTTALNYALPLFRLARVQCTSWGWPVTTGMPEVDYFVSSHALEPPEAREHYSEQLVLLDQLPLCYARPQAAPAPANREDFGLRRGEHLYLCLQNPRKIHPDFDEVLAAILRCDQQARVVLVGSSRPQVTEALWRRFETSLADVRQRVTLVARLPEPQYRGLLSQADVVLDTFHYGGGANTTYDAIAAGIPVVTWPGAFHRGRFAAAAYQCMGYTECVAATPAEYVELAVRLACDPASRRSARQAIESARDVLFDNAAAVQALEQFFAAVAHHVREAA